MNKKQYNPNDEMLGLDEKIPEAGERRRGLWGEALFFSPRPQATTLPFATRFPAAEVLEVNDIYMDIGQGNHGKAFQVQLCVGGLLTIFSFFADSDRLKFSIPARQWLYPYFLLLFYGWVPGTLSSLRYCFSSSWRGFYIRSFVYHD